MAWEPDALGGQVITAPQAGPTANPVSKPAKQQAVIRRAAPAPIKANSKGNYARPAAPPQANPGPVVPSIDSYLGGDAGYQDQMRQFAQTLGNFNADATRRRGSLESSFGLSSKALEDQKVKDLLNMEADYGSRGMIHSGLYGNAVGDYNTEFGNRMSDLQRQQTDALGALQQEQGQFQSTQQLKEQAAREMAIRRRAEQFGV
jgi:hypothetical protein